MRLVCPNCDAQYQVDDSAIPEDGRDVQCSNCGHTWFQTPPDVEAEIEAERALFDSVTAQVDDPVDGDKAAPAIADDSDDDDGEAVEPVDPPDDVAQAIAKTLSASEQESEALADEDADEEESPRPASTAPPVLPSKGLDENLLNVLREEAEREAAARRAEPPRALETQADLGLEETAGAASAAMNVREKLARLRGKEPETEEIEKPAARRDLLPDIEEINSTLRASSENRADEEEEEFDLPDLYEHPRSRSGFRSGFALILFIAVVLVVAYVAAPRIAEQFPASAGAMDSYVVAVDQGRVWLDGMMRKAISGLQGLTGTDKK